MKTNLPSYLRADVVPNSIVTIIVLLIVVFVPDCQAQEWVQTKGPYGARATAMTSVGDNIYVANRDHGGTDGRVYRSANFGEQWTAVDNGIGAAYVQQFANIGEIIIAAAGTFQVFRTTNQGDNWNSIVAGVFAPSLSVEAVGNTFWCGTEGGGILKSIDFGLTWSPKNNGLGFGQVIVYDIESLNGYLYIACEGGGGPARLYRSSDNGESWQYANVGLPLGTNPHYLTVNGNTLYVSSQGDFADYEYGLYKSTDFGATWIPANNGIPVILNGNTGPVWAHEGIVYVGTTFPDASPKIYKSTDDGTSFIPVSTGLHNDNQHIYAFASAGEYVFAGAGWYASVFRSANEGGTWEEARRGLANTEIFSLMEHNGRLYAGAQEGLFYTTDMGSNWTEMQNGLPFGLPVTTMEKNGNSIYLGTDQYGVYKSDDGGNTWFNINNGLSGLYAEYIEDLLYFDGALYAATWDGIYKTTNNGVSWSFASSGLPEEFGGSLVSVNAITESNGVLYAGTVLEGIFKSANGGASWTAANTGLTFYARTIHDFTVVGSAIFAGTDDGVYKSVDQGASWQIQPTVDAGPFRTIYSANGVLYASNYGPTVLTGYTIFTSTDGGATWQEIDDGMFPMARVTAFQIHNGFIFSGTDTRSVWTFGSTLATYKPISNQNGFPVMPNPSNGQFRIMLGTHTTAAEVSIFNSLGQNIYLSSETVDDVLSIDISNQPRGVYMVSIRIGSEMIMKKIIIR